MKLAPLSKMSSHIKVSAATLAANEDKKAPALALLRTGYSAGAVARNLDVTESVAIHWRNEAGIPPCKPGKGRPMPAVGEVLV